MLTVDCLLIHSLKTITGFIDRNQRQSVKGIHSNQIIIQLAKQQITSCLEYACNHKLKQITLKNKDFFQFPMKISF